MTWPSADPERWLLGLAASRAKWPHGAYQFVLPPAALPLYHGHEKRWIVPSGRGMPGDIGTCRLFREVDGQGLVVLAEIGAAYPSVMWDVTEGRLAGLSIGYCLDDAPGGGQLIYVSEVSLTRHPGDGDARVLSAGRLALEDWETLTGEHAGVLDTARG